MSKAETGTAMFSMGTFMACKEFPFFFRLHTRRMHFQLGAVELTGFVSICQQMGKAARGR